MAYTKVSAAKVNLTANGTVSGYVSVPDNTKFPVGATVYLNGTALNTLECVVTEQLGTNQLGLRKTNTNTPPTYGRTDVSAYTVAAASNLSMQEQILLNSPAASVVVDSTQSPIPTASSGAQLSDSSAAFQVQVDSTVLDVGRFNSVFFWVQNQDGGGVSRTVSFYGIADDGTQMAMGTVTVNSGASAFGGIGIGASVNAPLPRRIQIVVSAGTGTSGSCRLVIHAR